MAQTISLNIDIEGQDELLQATQRVNQLTKEKKNLNKQLKDGKITQAAYDKAIAKNNVNLSVARRRTNELNRELIRKSKILKDSRSFTQKLTGSMTKMVVGIGAAIAAFKGLTNAITATITAYGEQAEAETRLLTATQGNVEMQQSLIETAQELQQISTFGDEEIIAQQAYLASLGMTEEQINEVIKASMDLAVGTGQTLEFGVKNLAKTFGGLTGELGESLPMLKELTKEQLIAGEAVDVVAEAFRGQAQAVSETGIGPLKKLNNVWGDLKEQGGEVLMKFLTPFINKMVKWIPKIPGYFRNVTRAVYDTYNWFVELYNESLGFRVVVEGIAFAFESLWDVAKGTIRLLRDGFGGIGDIIAGIFTFDRSRITRGWNRAGDAMTDSLSSTASDIQGNWNRMLNNIQEGTAKKLVLSEEEAEKVTQSYAGVVKKTNQEIKKEQGKVKSPFEIDIEQLKRNHTLALNAEKENLIKGLITKDEYNQRIFEEQVGHLELMKMIYEAYGKDITNIDAQILSEKIKNMKKEQDAFVATDATKLDVAKAGLDILTELGNRRTQRELEALENKNEQGLVSEEQYLEQKENIERKAFNRKKKTDIANIIMNFAGANSKTFQELGFPAGLAAIPLLTGIMMAQIALVAGQQFADGGLVGGGMFEGPSHAMGGIKFASGGRLMEAEGGEAIINKRSTSMFKPLLSSINQAGGGVKFADGGILNGFTDNFQMAGQYGGSRSEVVVVESDITSTQNTVNNIQSTASI